MCESITLFFANFHSQVRLKNKGGERANGVEIAPRYKYYSLRHCCLVLLEIDMQKSENSHDPELDARYSVELFKKYHKKVGRSTNI